MDNGLVQPVFDGGAALNEVLILIVVDNGLVRDQAEEGTLRVADVLILIVVDNGLVQKLNKF